jgi:hypothetical protein
VLILLLAILLDFAMLTEGAFRFNTDESMVGASDTNVRVARAMPARVEVPPPSGRGAVVHSTPLKPHPAVQGPSRPDLPPVRVRLLVAADGERTLEDH